MRRLIRGRPVRYSSPPCAPNAEGIAAPIVKVLLSYAPPAAAHGAQPGTGSNGRTMSCGTAVPKPISGYHSGGLTFRQRGCGSNPLRISSVLSMHRGPCCRPWNSRNFSSGCPRSRRTRSCFSFFPSCSPQTRRNRSSPRTFRGNLHSTPSPLTQWKRLTRCLLFSAT